MVYVLIHPGSKEKGTMSDDEKIQSMTKKTRE